MTDQAATHPEPTVDADFLAILVCPLMRCPLEQQGDELVATRPVGGGLRYPIRDGIPVLLMDEAALPEGVSSLEDFKAKYADQLPK